MKRLFFAVTLLVSTSVFADDLPDPSLTPGVTDSTITQENIQETICVKGYTKTVRPPAYYTNKLKKWQMMDYGYENANPKDYQEDHLIALSLGGAPRDSRNLWPQPHKSEWNASKKDQLEAVLYKMVCNNEIGLIEAQNAMATNWIVAWKKYVPSHSKNHFAKGE